MLLPIHIYFLSLSGLTHYENCRYNQKGGTSIRRDFEKIPLVLTHTFVFLGCGISDPDIQLILENMNFLYPGRLPHYFVTAKDTYSKEIEKSLLHNRNLELLIYDNSDGTHQQLLVELKELIGKVKDKRQEISSKGIW